MMSSIPKDNAHPAIIPTSISRTASDSLHAKLSAIDGGWLDGGGGGRGENNAAIAGPVDGYLTLLRRIRDGIVVEGGTARSRRSRQTPLVNAGYAARVAVVTFVFERWLDRVASYYADHETRTDTANSRGINVVMLGGGMDALGLWSKRLLHNLIHSSQASEGDEYGGSSDDRYVPPLPTVRVYEFDAWDNCVFKRQALVNSGMLQESCSYENANRDSNHGVNQSQPSITTDFDSTSKHSLRTISKGKITLDGIRCRNDEHESDDYCLVALDLRESCPSKDAEDHDVRPKSILSQAMHSVGLDVSQPTIVLSELVLAYLGYDGANAVMRSIATDVLRGNGFSMFACLEPVFPSDLDDLANDRGSGGGHARVLSVEEGYSRDYSQKFLSKLKRGNSEKCPTKSGAYSDPSSSWFHPLGSDSRGIRTRLRHCGFSLPNICFTSLGNAVANVAHIRRSAGASNFLRAKEPFDEHAALALNLNCYGVACAFSPASDRFQDWIGDICPWIAAKGDAAPRSVRICPIASLPEDGQVRDLYGKIYVHLYEEYPAIRKMVKSALKMDLRTHPAKGGNDYSAIRNRFKDKDGEFWIAKDVDKSRIIGCVGVRQRKKRENDDKTSMTSSTVVVEYEVQRLVVDDQYRGKGYGKNFLGVIEEYARRQQSRIESDNTPVTIKLWAVTPECLIAANKLYESVGYKKEETFQAGSLCMNVYCKLLHR